MLDLPKKIIDMISQMKCPHCGAILDHENVSAIKICKNEKIRNRASLLIDYSCSVCNEKYSISLYRTTITDFATEVYEEVSKDKRILGKNIEDKKNIKNKSKISLDELRDLRKKLETFKTHEDFLNYIGLNSKEIEKYSRREEKDKNNQNE